MKKVTNIRKARIKKKPTKYRSDCYLITYDGNHKGWCCECGSFALIYTDEHKFICASCGKENYPE